MSNSTTQVASHTFNLLKAQLPACLKVSKQVSHAVRFLPNGLPILQRSADAKVMMLLLVEKQFVAFLLHITTAGGRVPTQFRFSSTTPDAGKYPETFMATVFITWRPPNDRKTCKAFDPSQDLPHFEADLYPSQITRPGCRTLS